MNDLLGADDPTDLERQVRITCRDRFRETRLMERILPDITKALDVPGMEDAEDEFAADAARPAKLWQPHRTSDSVPIGQVLKMHTFVSRESTKDKADGRDDSGTSNTIATG